MTPVLYEALASLLDKHANQPFVLALSGGMDSCVLLDALRRLAPEHPLRLIHVHHGLQDDAGAWAHFANQLAQRYGVPLTVVPVQVSTQGQGLEAAARAARYKAIAAHMHADEWLLTAHHQRDQAETVLLNLARGAGPRGLQGMRPAQIFSGLKKVGDPPLRILRPLLNVPYEELVRYAQVHQLQWVEDPSNGDTRFLRNAIRHHWLPTMAQDVPHIEARLTTAARWLAESVALLEELAQQDLSLLGASRWRLPLNGFAALSEPRQKNVLRHWLLQHLEYPPSERQLQRLLHDVVHAREDAKPVFRWPQGWLHRFHGVLFWVSRSPAWDAALPADRRPFRMAGCPGCATTALQPLQHTNLTIKPFKKRFQALGVPPWLRPWWPVCVHEDGVAEPLGLAPDSACRVDFIAECGGMG